MVILESSFKFNKRASQAVNYNYLYIFFTIILTALSHIILKWRLNTALDYLSTPTTKVQYIVYMFKDPFIILSYLMMFLGSFVWMIALSKFDLSHAFPFTGLTYVLVTYISWAAFNESISLQSLLGVLTICAGIVISARG